MIPLWCISGNFNRYLPLKRITNKFTATNSHNSFVLQVEGFGSKSITCPINQSMATIKMEKATQTTSESVWGSAQLSSTSERSLKFVDLWATTEIAEMILAHLPIQDLLLAQRVCTGWRNLIKGSPVLQENLFLRPRHCRTTQRGSSDGMPVREYNPLLIEHMARWFNILRCSDGDSDRVSFDKPGIEKKKAFLHRNASWRNMLLAQPPFTIFESVKTLYTNDRAEVLSLSVGSIERPDGVRMGLAYDKAVELAMSKRGTFPRYFWTLMDGMFAPVDDVDDDDDELERQHGVEKPERLFGGIGKFTMVTDTRPVSRVTLDAVRERIRHRYTSAGFEQVDILYHRVEPLDNETYNLGRWCWVFPWWDGYGYRNF